MDGLNRIAPFDALPRESPLAMPVQDLRVASGLDALALMDSGRLRAFGPPASVLTPEALAEVFGVRVRTAAGLVFELP